MSEGGVVRLPARDKRLRPLESEGVDGFSGQDIPTIKWIIPGVLVEGGVTLFSGQGGKGKSLLCMQMQAALATGQHWLGIEVDRMSSLALYCEDERIVLHRRFEDIRIHYGVDFSDLELARFKSRVGEQNELMRFWGKKQDEGEITGFFRQVAEEIENWGVRVLIVDTVADCFGGNENFRSQVRTFVNKMRQLVLANRGGVILNAHPSRAGLADGSGLSGSTGWENSVRGRINLTEPRRGQDEDGEDAEPSKERILKVMKNNYGPAGTKWRLTWDRGVFTRTDGTGPLGTVERLELRGKLMEAARYLVSQGARPILDANPANSLINLARKLPSCREIPWTVLRKIQDGLVEESQLEKVPLGPKSKIRIYVRPNGMTFPEEQESLV